MRIFYVGIAIIAAVAGAGGIRASAIGTGPTGIDPLAAHPTIPKDVAGNPNGLSKPRQNAIRVAQSAASLVATSGNPIAAPFKWVGSLRIPAPTQKYPNATNLCTAQFIAPSVLLTAGHCIKDLPSSPAGPWPDPTKGKFFLQYQNGIGTEFPIVCAAANPLWTLPSNFNSLTAEQQNTAMNAAWQHDFAMILVNGTSPTGVMPYALDWKGKYTFADRIGYPADILSDQIVQDAPGFVFFATDVPIGAWAIPKLVVQWGPVTDATEGMSGGAWVANSNMNAGANNNILIAVTSFGANYQGTNPFPGGTFAAYLTAAEFNPLLASVSNGCK